MTSKPMQAVEEYWEEQACGTNRAAAPKLSKEYFRQIEQFRYRHEPFIEEFARFDEARDLDVLEVGIGAGTDFMQWVRAGANTVGIDLTSEAMVHASRRLELEDLEARLLGRADCTRLPFADESFDIVYSWGVLHHSGDPIEGIRECVRVARRGGVIRVMVYNLNSFHAWRLFLRHGLFSWERSEGRRGVLARYQESPGTTAFSRGEVEALLASLPVRDVRLKFWDQRIRRGARWALARRAIRATTPAAWRWYMAIECRRE